MYKKILVENNYLFLFREENKCLKFEMNIMI